MPETTAPQAPVKADPQVTRGQLVFLLVYSVLMLVLPVIGVLVMLFQPVPEGIRDALPLERTLILACLLGASAGCIHSLASISLHAGKSELTSPWIPFYLCRPFVGAGMALVTSLVLVSGLGGFKVTDEVAIIAWASLAGLYSQPALDKLRDVFSSLFATREQLQEQAAKYSAPASATTEAEAAEEGEQANDAADGNAAKHAA